VGAFHYCSAEIAVPKRWRALTSAGSVLRNSSKAESATLTSKLNSEISTPEILMDHPHGRAPQL
jgi:hypothetical protein